MTEAVQGSKLLFADPVPLSPELHGAYGLTEGAAAYEFARRTHIVPVSESEFAFVCDAYPIIFMGDEKIPVAVLGLRPDQNLFVTEDGAWRTGRYVPAYIRQHPFVVAKDSKSGQDILCVDRSAPRLTDKEPMRRFFDDGRPSDFLQQAMSLCRSLEADVQKTREKTRRLDALSIFETATLAKDGRLAFGGEAAAGQMQFVGVNLERLKTRSDADKAALVSEELMGLVYAFVFSQKNWSKLFEAASGRS